MQNTILLELKNLYKRIINQIPEICITHWSVIVLKIEFKPSKYLISNSVSLKLILCLLLYNGTYV